MKNILLLLVVCNLFLPHTCLKSYSTRRVKGNIPAQTVYFYQDRLGLIGKLLSDPNNISEDERAQILETAAALRISEENVKDSLADTAGTRSLIQKIAKRALISLAGTIQDGNMRYLEVVNRIPAAVLGLLGNLHQEKVLSESELKQNQEYLGDILFGVLTSDDSAVTKGERMIALKGLEEYGVYEDVGDLLAIRLTPPSGIKREDLDAAVNILTGKFAPRFESFSELKKIVKDSPKPVLLRMKDNSFLSIKDLQIVSVLWYEIAFIEYSDGRYWQGSWKQFLKEEVLLPVVWNDFALTEK